MKDSHFFAMLSRMKYINRWGLMINSREQNDCEHSLEVAYIAHALGIINNTIYEGHLNAERMAADKKEPTQTLSLKHLLIFLSEVL